MFLIKESFNEGIITVGRFVDKEDRDKAFEKNFVHTTRNGFKVDKEVENEE